MTALSFKSGTGKIINLSPSEAGVLSKLYIRKKGSNIEQNFASHPLILEISPRDDNPNVNIDFDKEELTPNIQSTQEYLILNETEPIDWGMSIKPNIETNITLGNQAAGTRIYVRYKAVPSQNKFASKFKLLLMKGRRPFNQTFSIDYLNTSTVEEISSDIRYSDNVNLTNSKSGQDQPIFLNPGAVESHIYFYLPHIDGQFRSETKVVEN